MSIAASGVIPVSQLTTPVNPLDQLPGTQSSSSSASPSTVSPNDFLTLLTTELQNQDPTQPQDPTQSVTQLAQFSALQYQAQLATDFQGFQSNFAVLQASSLVGKQVTVQITDGNGNSSSETGTINSIAVQNGQPYFTMINPATGQAYTDNNGNPLLFSLQQILGIGNGSSSGGTGGTGGSTGGSTGGNSTGGTGSTGGTTGSSGGGG